VEASRPLIVFEQLLRDFLKVEEYHC